MPPLPPQFGPPIGPDHRPIPPHSFPPFRPPLVDDVEHNTWRATATDTDRRTSGIPGVWPRRRRRLRRRRLRPFRARKDLCRDPHVCRFRLPRPQGSRDRYPVVPLRTAPARSAQHQAQHLGDPTVVDQLTPDCGACLPRSRPAVDRKLYARRSQRRPCPSRRRRAPYIRASHPLVRADRHADGSSGSLCGPIDPRVRARCTADPGATSTATMFQFGYSRGRAKNLRKGHLFLPRMREYSTQNDPYILPRMREHSILNEKAFDPE